MAVRSSASVERPDHTRLMAGDEGREMVQSEGKVVNRQGGTSATADFDIQDYDLVDEGDWDLSVEKADQFDGTNPDIGGTAELGIFIESQLDNQFSVAVEWKDGNDNTVGRVDQAIDSDLLSTSPSNGNHFVYVTVAVASDRFNVTITDEAGLNNNDIDGTINAH